ncbi:lysophospholipid transporter LplT [Methylomagnum ishizawai]|uniref:lysophospholipid transporter LplT n=1 Tax=Methylomagnum ishizawai TaxID=1760988 RepID=UPI001C328CFB|nr:lysophospholipid transporter LplT [Methylomagnum ishizawai]BBL77160.1 lysophospholipid transporter LplT [Methylomagnum ishizawai]
MSLGFFTILAAQFFSSLADNALLFGAIALLREQQAPSWQTPVLQQSFVVAFIVLAPFVGPFADALPKGRVMFVSNAVKIAGCLGMLMGVPPLLAYAVVGVGGAMYSPAKYGILTEYFPPEKLVWANGWLEGLTVAAIILGAIIGGLLIGDRVGAEAARLLAGLPFNFGIDTVAEFAIAAMLGFYALAALFNLYIPRLPIDHKLPSRSLGFILKDFLHCFVQLWKDPLGQVSLAVTALFWGAGATLRLIVLMWAAAALHLGLEQATQLTAVVAVGIGFGAAWAGKAVPLEHSVRVLPVGIAMGLVVSAMAWVSDWRVALPMLALIGAMGGYFVVPMNALLQHRGHTLMGAGHSIALQNFNENLSILLMLGLYALMIKVELSANAIVVVFGLIVAGSMAVLTKLHGHDQD